MASLLIVDNDDKLLAGLVRRFFQVRPDWKITTAASGDEALKLLEVNAYEALVTDIDMPGMSGVELISYAAAIAPTTQRIAISGYFDCLTTYSMSNCPHMFLAKPVQISRLAKMIESALAAHHEELDRVAPFTIGEHQLTLWSNTVEISSDERQCINRKRLRRLGINIVE